MTPPKSISREDFEFVKLIISYYKLKCEDNNCIKKVLPNDILQLVIMHIASNSKAALEVRISLLLTIQCLEAEKEGEAPPNVDILGKFNLN